MMNIYHYSLGQYQNVYNRSYTVRVNIRSSDFFPANVAEQIAVCKRFSHTANQRACCKQNTELTVFQQCGLADWVNLTYPKLLNPHPICNTTLNNTRQSKHVSADLIVLIQR